MSLKSQETIKYHWLFPESSTPCQGELTEPRGTSLRIRWTSWAPPGSSGKISNHKLILSSLVPLRIDNVSLHGSDSSSGHLGRDMSIGVLRHLETLQSAQASKSTSTWVHPRKPMSTRTTSLTDRCRTHPGSRNAPIALPQPTTATFH